MFHDFWKQILTICQIPITELRFQLDPLIQFFDPVRTIIITNVSFKINFR